MPVVSQMQHPLSLSFDQQRQAVLLRDVKGESFAAIAAKLKNLKGQRTTKEMIRRVCSKFSRTAGIKKSNYHKCGLKPYKVTPSVCAFLLRRMHVLRRRGDCTSSLLQRDLLAEKGVRLSTSAIRKVLNKKGYFWLPKSQKRLYSATVRAARVAFAKKVVELTPGKLREKLSLSMDGVILGMPPSDSVERQNYCAAGASRMWRKRGEAAKADLAGGDRYSRQIPLSRSIPIWGGISQGGYAMVLQHDLKKVTSEEWAAAVDGGKLVRAVKALQPVKAAGPWHVLCDNESFLTAPASRAAHAKAKIHLWKIPARSPDLNPVERFWGWLRAALRKKDLDDIAAKRPVPSRAAYIMRVKALCRTAKAQQVAKNFAKVLRKVCVEVIEKKGAASKM